MNDLVQRLREAEKESYWRSPRVGLLDEAADEIERLKDYRRARRNYWHSGGRTEMGADRFT
jgi:hypothetical protein